jgi:hypothetical protein
LHLNFRRKYGILYFIHFSSFGIHILSRGEKLKKKLPRVGSKIFIFDEIKNVARKATVLKTSQSDKELGLLNVEMIDTELDRVVYYSQYRKAWVFFQLGQGESCGPTDIPVNTNNKDFRRYL